MQLFRILQHEGLGTRRECIRLIALGKVSVLGKIVKNPFEFFESESLEFAVDNNTWIFQKNIYLIMNKPAGYECSHHPQHYPSIFCFLPGQLLNRGVQCVGRLDQDTTGLLLFSDDGEFIHKMSSGKKDVKKTYLVKTFEAINQKQADALKLGVLLKGESLPVQAKSLTPLSDNACLLSITSGKYHQVKRMFAAVGNQVISLKRTSVGDLELDESLRFGEWRYLTESDFNLLNFNKKTY